MSLYSCGTSDEQRRLQSFSEPVIDDNKVEDLLGCDTRPARTTAKCKQNFGYWFRAAALDRGVCI